MSQQSDKSLDKNEVLALAAWLERDGANCQRHLDAAVTMKALLVAYERELASRQSAQRQLESTQEHSQRLCHAKDIEKSKLITEIESLKAILKQVVSCKPAFKPKVLRTGGSGALSGILQGGYDKGVAHMAAEYRKHLRKLVGPVAMSKRPAEAEVDRQA